jgi:2-methylisocitrate lyase-like PEP mutase family enzyme
MTKRTTAEKRAIFRALHEQGCFVMPNPWDVGSARYLQGLGFKALATTSAGLAWSLGHSDNFLSRDQVLAHMREIVEATDLPVNADFENGFGSNAQDVAESVRLAIETGVAAISIEDTTGDPARPVFDLDVAVSRLRAARRAIDESGGDTYLVGRADNFFAGVQDLEDTIARLKAYAAAGADCLYAPGIYTRDQIKAVVAAVSPRPVNLLVASAGEFNLQNVAALGVRRISLGGALAAASWGGFMRAARLLAEEGRFDELANSASGAQLNAFFRISEEEHLLKQPAQIVGKVEYREGEGPLTRVPIGTVEVETSASDAIVTWPDGTSHGLAAMPVANFCQYVADGAIIVAKKPPLRE